MDKWQKNKIAQGFNRASEIKVSTKGKEAIESVAIAHLAAGNIDGFVTGMSTLNKIEVDSAVVQDVAQMKQIMGGILTQLNGNNSNVGDDVDG